MIFCDLLWFFKDLVKIKNKRKIEKPLTPHPKTAQGGYVNGFVSLWMLNGRFCGPGRKSRFGSKLREAKMTFFNSELEKWVIATCGPARIQVHVLSFPIHFWKIVCTFWLRSSKSWWPTALFSSQIFLKSTRHIECSDTCMEH